MYWTSPASRTLNLIVVASTTYSRWAYTYLECTQKTVCSASVVTLDMHYMLLKVRIVILQTYGIVTKAKW